MNSLFILLFISWISYAVSTVDIKEDEYTAIPTNNFRLTCEITGSDTFKAWTNPDHVVVHNKTGFKYITSGIKHKLTILKVTIHDAGTWTCISKQGNNDSVFVNVAVAETPKDSAKKTQYLLKDSPGIIKINILGYPKPTFEWIKDGKSLDLTMARYSIADNGSLLISKVDENDEGEYSVTGSQGPHESDIDNIVGIVHALPTFNSVVINEIRTLHGNITFGCNATGIPTPSISWKHDSKDINADDRHEITTSGLTIKDIEKSDVGEYTCVANNTVGAVKQTSKLSSVLVPPKIQPISDVEVEKGKQLNVYCNVSGDPPPSVKWINIANVTVVNEQMLTIKNVQPSNSGTYTCVARNNAVDERGKEIVQSQSMKVDVIYPPEFNLKYTSTTVPISPNKPVEIKCSASGNPIPTLTLSFGDKDLERNVSKESNITSLVLSLNFTKASLGAYVCTASNKLKEIKHIIKVSIPLDIPKIIDVKPGCNNVTFSWRSDTKNSIKIKTYLVTLNHSNVVKERKSHGGDISQSSFDGLEENSKYYLSVKQVTEINGIGHTAKKSFQTGVCALEKMNELKVKGNEIRLYWPQATEDIQSYIVKYRIKNSKDWIKRNVDEVTTKIEGLNYGATYEFQVFVLVSGVEKPYTHLEDRAIEKDPSKEQSSTPKPDTTESAVNKTTEQPASVARKGGISGGAIAAIVIVIILLVLIAVDIFCCFFNQCGVVHMCAAACSGKNRNKYEVDGDNPEEGTELKAHEESKEPVA